MMIWLFGKAKQLKKRMFFYREIFICIVYSFDTLILDFVIQKELYENDCRVVAHCHENNAVVDFS